MNIAEVKNRVWLLKESVKSRVLDIPSFTRLEPKEIDANPLAETGLKLEAYCSN